MGCHLLEQADPFTQGNGCKVNYDILFINLTGALLLAFCMVLADATFLLGPTRRLFVNVGFLGAYTTFSSLAMGDVLLLTHDA
jgi:fluoride ion exporter CrcB/FEX